ncbi:hypothetical protein phiV141_32 [Vibrio phage phiV141]|uniref:Scaffolding protein n=1 Tax=Vibrio phage phiV141 TaxID=2723905 RepID=A0A7D7IF36_9CAUD|nr:hypothetical protein phiV141_32 [Vibrio phage phiV141]
MAGVAPQQQPQGDPNGAPYQAPQPQQQQQAPVVPAAGQPVFVQDEQGNYVQVVQQPVQQPIQSQPQQEEVQVQAINESRAQVEGFLKVAGIQASQVEQEVIALGGISEGTKKALVDKHGEATTNLIVNQINSIASAQKASEQQLATMQHTMVQEAFAGVTDQSGEQTWNELIGWCRTNVDVETRTSLNNMMKAGGFQAKQAIEFMVNTFKQKNGIEQTGQLLNGANEQGSSTNTELTASTYSRELEKIVAKHGYDSPERKALDAQRMQSRQRTGR